MRRMFSATWADGVSSVPDSLLQYILELLGQIASPVVLGSGLEHYSLASVRHLIAEGLLKETEAAEEIPRPARYGYGVDLTVRRTAIGLFGVADGDDFCEPVRLTEHDVRQYAISIHGLVERLRKENGISGAGSHPDHGLIAVGEKFVAGAAGFDVYLSCPNPDVNGLLGRLRQLDPCDRAIVVLTPTPIQVTPEQRRMLTDDGVTLTSLFPVAENDELVLEWSLSARRGPADRSSTVVSESVGTKRKRTAGSPEAVEAVKAYLTAKVMDLTQFSIQSQMTDRTVRRFLEKGEVQRANFKTMAEGMGLTAEQLLRGELPASVKRRPPR